jgi:hypothetical protein
MPSVMSLYILCFCQCVRRNETFMNYNNIKKAKNITMLLCSSLVLILLLTGCNLKTRENDTNKNQISIMPTETSQPSSSELEPTIAIDNDDTDTTEDPKIEDFQVMDAFFKDYNFDVSYDENLEFYERIYTVDGAYDMNGDGEDDNIFALLKANYQEESYIEVNGNKYIIDYCNPSGDIKMIDLDGKDTYTEIAVFDDGPSGDPNLMFFRYDGKELHFVGSIDQGALMDGYGKIISSFLLTRYFEPQFYSAWGEFKDGEYVLTNHDITQYIGNTYVVNGAGFFEPMDQMPENYLDYAKWDSDTVIDFNDTKVKILDIYISDFDPILNWFFVELPDGEKGLLYFWIGD